LDFKIIAANTLIAAPQEHEAMGVKVEDEFFTKFSDLTHDYFKVANPDDKHKLRDKIETLINAKCAEKIKAIESLSHNEAKYKKQIDQLESHKKLWQSYANLFKHEAVAFFEPRYFFPQLSGGFDIVIGNPPYVISNDKRLKERYAESVYGRSNLYGFFIHLSIESLMNENGILSFINPKTILADAYFSGLRKFILNHAKVSQILDINNRKDVFENVLQSVIVNFYSKKSDKTKVKNISTKDEILLNNHIFISQEDMIFDDKNTSIFIVSRHPETYKIFKRLKDFPSFQEAGIKFTTGKIQWDLYKKYLSDSPANDCTQLIWAENIQRFFLQPAKLRADKIYLNTSIDDKILINHQTIVVQRTTAVEQSYRIIATIIDPLSFGYSIQTENNTSYIEKTNPDLDLKFILSLLNSRFYDFIFRHINSNTHVSGGELNSLPDSKNSRNRATTVYQISGQNPCR
jgi:tRNA1(Val) A37 N6-methylase TrmN6